MQYSLGGMLISHLAYADDFMIFTKAHEEGLKRIMAFLSSYEVASGQLINVTKSSFVLITCFFVEEVTNYISWNTAL